MAAGRGARLRETLERRAGGDGDLGAVPNKAFFPVAGRPLLHWTLEALAAAGAVTGAEAAAVAPAAAGARPLDVVPYGYRVEGAGSAEADGLYVRDGEYGGAPLFKKVSLQP